MEILNSRYFCSVCMECSNHGSELERYILMLEVTSYTGGAQVPSARFRVRQYIPLLIGEGVEIREVPSRFGQYPPESRLIRPLWGAGAVGANFMATFKSWGTALTLLQREMISTMVTLEPFTKAPRVLDVDDAIFLLRQGKAAKRLAGMCETVICGNNYLAEWFSQYNSRIEILPTAVDTERYFVPSRGDSDDTRVIIGWIGTSGNLKFLSMLEEALARVLHLFPRAHLRVVSDQRPELNRLPLDRWEYNPWTPETEVGEIQGMDIGLMPLEDSPWARGKCSFKMLQYMACSIPVVVSPVGMNQEVLVEGEVGMGPRCTREWVDALAGLVADSHLRRRLGVRGREIVEAKYSLRGLAPRLASILKQAASHSPGRADG
jgi:glycosyltransferase involved in cell wall biosynthesis